MAAVIVAGLLFALTRTANKGFVRDEPEAFYDLTEEIGFETKRVLDYGVINSQSLVTTGTNTRSLISKYSEYVAREDIVFIYGDLSNVSAIYYDSEDTVRAIQLSGSFISVPIATQTAVDVAHNKVAGTATVKIKGNDYTFELKSGQNFYFVVIKGGDNEQFVALE